ncbi:NB-ARC domain-containing protein [Saccharothrix carnea]|uniref:NB-ARC domain-containing protein n=1 Tax=Saccharothrix carnea TaxID=1280637 RepID=A0A2P8ICD7_SACCR|nr:NB-ARC domain-containing protein [Saccharothrix carnea]
MQAGTVHGGVHLHHAPRSQRPVPRQLPPDTSRFTGREDALSRLDARAGTATLITGTAGVGKTALAVRWAHRHRDRFPDGQLYVDMRGYSPRGPLTADQALEGFLHALDVDPERVPVDPEDKAALYRSVTDGRRFLVLVDNVSAADQARPLLAASDTVTVLVTSRNRLPGLVSRDGVGRLGLDVLSPAESISLLRATAGGDRVDADPAAAARLADQCARLPLALRVAAERCADAPFTTLADLTADLAAEQDRLDLLSSGDDPNAAVRAVLSWSYRALPADAAAAFRAFGLHVTSEASLDALAVLLDLPAASTRRVVDTLVAAHLVEPTARDRYRVHDLLRAYAVERANADQPPEEGAAAVRRVLAWYLHTAFAADRTLLPLYRRTPLPAEDVTPLDFADRAAAMRWCEAERANLVGAVRLAADAGHHDLAGRFPSALWSFFDLRKLWADWTAVFEIGLTSTRITGDRHAEADVLNWLGVAFHDTGRYDRAIDHHQEALAVSREIGDQLTEAGALANLSSVYRRLARFDEALDCLHRSLTIRRATRDLRGEAITLNRLGAVYRDLGRLDESLDHLRRSLDLRKRTGDRHGEGFAHHSLAATYEGLRQSDLAVAHYRRCIEAHREVGNLSGEAKGLDCLGKVLDRTGDTTGAKAVWEQALAIYETIGSAEAYQVRARLAG